MDSYAVGQTVREWSTWTINETRLAAAAAAGATTISVYRPDGWAAADVLAINPNGDTEQTPTVSSISGKVVTLTAALTSAWSHGVGETVGELADPTTLTLVVEDPAGTETTYTYAGGDIVKSAVGRYYYDAAYSSAGTYKLKWAATGTVKGVVQRTVNVVSSVT